MSLSGTTVAARPVPAAKGGKVSKTIAYYAAFVALGLVAASLGPTLPGLAEHTHTRLSEISFLFTARSLGYLLGSLLGGRLYDQVPGHWVMVTVLMMMAVMLYTQVGQMAGILTVQIALTHIPMKWYNVLGAFGGVHS